jgi:dTDP-4-dehydrorhamnose 3,5-epimerase
VIFTETKLKGAFLVDLEPHKDERGFFARSFCRREFEALGLKPVIAQSGLARNRKKGTLRGMHFQFPPAAETKLVRCIRGKILDVIVDLRPESETYLQHFAVELDGESLRALYVPERFAHGYQSLSEDTIASYELGAFHAPGAGGGLLYSDPRLAVSWPLPVAVISLKDRCYRPLKEIEGELKRKMRIADHAKDLARCG